MPYMGWNESTAGALEGGAGAAGDSLRFEMPRQDGMRRFVERSQRLFGVRLIHLNCWSCDGKKSRTRAWCGPAELARVFEE